MKPFPAAKIQYEVWYIDNYDDSIEPWRVVGAESYPEALRIMEGLTSERRPYLNRTRYHIIEVSRRAVASQTVEFDKSERIPYG